MVVQRGLSRQHADFLRSLDVDPGILEDSEREVLTALLDAIGNQHKPAEQPVGKDRTLVADLSQNSDGGSLTIQKHVDVTTGTLDTLVTFTPKGRSSLEWKTSRRMRLRRVRIRGELSAPKTEVEKEPESQEGVNAFLRGALMGDFAEDSSFSAIAGQTVVGFIPIVGQVADIRDLGAALKRAYDGETGAMLDVSIAIVGFVPGMDWLKGGNKVAKSNIVYVGGKVGKQAGRGAEPNRKYKKIFVQKPRQTRDFRRVNFNTKRLPRKFQDALNDALKHIRSKEKPEYASNNWGKAYKNKGGKLPKRTLSGKKATYKEYNIKDVRFGGKDSVDRLVVCKEDGRIYYSGTHYGDRGGREFARIY